MEKSNLKPRMNVRRIAVAGVLSAISVILSLTPSLGYIPIPPITITTMHIPVIIAAILEGPVVGGMVGLIFGLSSMYTAATIFAGWPTAFPFLNPLVSVLPRILIGVVAYYAYVGIKKLFKVKSAAAVAGAVAGTLTNTIGVLGMIYILYAQRYVDAVVQSAKAQGQTMVVKSLFAVIFGGVFLNAVAEIVMASLLCIPVVFAVERIRKR
ncbi:MAG: ECF transporter S component [Clostridia bacterium]|nr:ECF transporter S component [Clostridia bacterium]